MKTNALAVIGGSVAVLALLIAALVIGPFGFRGCNDSAGNAGAAGGDDTLMLYCAAGIREPVEATIREYEEEYGVTFETSYKGSGTLLSDIRAAGKGDLYLAADIGYLERAEKLGLIAEIFPIADQYPVIVVAKGNPKNIDSLDDLAKEGVRVSLAEPGAAAIGKAVEQGLSKLGKWDALWDAKTTARSTVNEVANDVAKLNSADAGIVWNATAEQYDELEMVEVPELTPLKKQIAIAVLTTCETPAKALKFARYLTARDRGLKEFEKHAYAVINGDRWKETPELTVFSGSVNEPVASKIIEEFEKREGVQVNTTYNGCGILVGQMKTGVVPDMYFACDTCFVEDVKEMFGDPLNVAFTDIVIVTAAGNPKNIESPRDMLREDVRAIINNNTQSALGRITKRMLDAPQFGFWQELYDKAVDHPATGDIATMQVETDAVDAAIVYKTNAIERMKRGKLEIIPIDHPLAGATQPIVIQNDSDFPNLAGRLKQRLSAAREKQRYEDAGFRFLQERE